MKFTSEYDIGDRVYLRLRTEKFAGLITSIRFSDVDKHCSYMITWGDASESCHYAFELTKEYLKTYAEEE